MIFVKMGISLIAWSKGTFMKRFLSLEAKLDSGIWSFLSTTNLSGKAGRLEEDGKDSKGVGLRGPDLVSNVKVHQQNPYTTGPFSSDLLA